MAANNFDITPDDWRIVKENLIQLYCSITTISVGILPQPRVVAEDLTKGNWRECFPNWLQMALSDVGKQVTSESMDSHCSGRLGGTKNNQPTSSKPRVYNMHSYGSCPSGGAAGGSSWDHNKPREEVSHLAMYISNDDEFADDPHQIMPFGDAFAFPYLPRQNPEGVDCGYLLPAEVTGFWGTYCHESGDVRPGYTGASPWDYFLDHQGHVALKLHSSVAVFSSYIGLVLTWIVYPQQEGLDIKINQYSYFDIIEKIPPPNHHGIWGCFHYLPLVLNVFLAWYDSGTFLSHLTDGGYGFNAVGSPGIDMYQMYVVTSMVKGGMHCVGVGLIYKTHGLFAGNVEKCATFLRTLFNGCESEINMAPSQVYFLQKRRGVGPLCHPMPSWICVDTIIPCPGVIDKEGADTICVHSFQTITFQMMITTSHFFNGIEERSHVFIPLESKHSRDMMWRTAFFSYLDGVWEWVQVTSDHVANQYSPLAHAYAAAKASLPTHAQVLSIVPPIECSLAVTLPSAWLSHKEGPQPIWRV